MNNITIGGAALNQIPMDWSHNVSNIIQAIEDARKNKIDLLCLPELCLSGYGCEDLFLSNWLSEKAVSLLPEIANICTDIAVAVGLPLLYEGKTYNCTCLISDEKILGIVAKQNMAIDGVHYEFRWFEPWIPGTITSINIGSEIVSLGDIIFNIKGYSVGFEICEDAWRKERPADILSKKGIDIILNPSASHFALEKSIERENLVISSSGKYNCTYVYCNLLGNEAGRMIYDGDILIAHKGKLLAKNKTLSFLPYNITLCEIDPENQPELAKQIPAVLSREEEFTQATSLALFDYLRKSKSSGFVLSISGGADSATCAVLVSEMVRRASIEIGWKNFLSQIGKSGLLNQVNSKDQNEANQFVVSHLLTCAYQSTKNSSDNTFEAAKKLTRFLGADFLRWSVDDIVKKYVSKIEENLNKMLTWEKDDIALQNIQARARSPIIWMLANIKNAILLVTSNRSEGDVGYATMDGDTSGSLAPIAGIDKPFIRKWLLWAEKSLNISGLSSTNQLTPTAELRPLERNQTDEDDLMPYELMVQIERCAIRDHLSPLDTYQNLLVKNLTDQKTLKAYIAKFFRMWAKNQWKRERTAPSFHLDDFNVDPRTWCRFPILSSGFEDELIELFEIP